MKMGNQGDHLENSGSDWKILYKIGGVAALLAGIIFRRNLAAEISLFSARGQPETISDWFTLLQDNKLLGLAYLNLFDLLNYALLILMYLALFAALKRINRNLMLVATCLAIIGITVFFASNTAFSMLALSDQYANATTEAEKAYLLVAGQALLVVNRFSSPDAHPGTAGFISLLLIAGAGMITSFVMLCSAIFNRVTAIVGILASALDLAYCFAFVFLPDVDTETLALLFIPAAGLFLMIWHILVGWRLFKLGKKASLQKTS